MLLFYVLTSPNNMWDGNYEVANLFKGVLNLLPKISMFCALSQNYQHLEK